jgi:hypothetical protein
VEPRNTTTQIDAVRREAAQVDDAHVRPMMGPDVLEPLLSSRFPYRTVDPFILVHEAVVLIRSAGVSDRNRNKKEQPDGHLSHGLRRR